MNDIEEMFAALDGYQRYYDDLVIWGAHKVYAEGTWKREFKTRDPNGYRVHMRRKKQRYVDKHRDHMREVWKRNAKAYRARKKAAHAA